MSKRVVSMWFPRLASDRMLRARPVEGPFAVVLNHKNTNRLYCLNSQATAQGLHRGMPYSDARAYCPDLKSRSAELPEDRQFLHLLRRWATRYCPWVGIEGDDGLVLDITGSAHLFGGEVAMMRDIRLRLDRAGLAVRIGLGDTRGAAWALAHYGETPAGLAEPGAMLPHIGLLPVAALRLDDKICVALQRIGLRTIADLASVPRAPLARRFGAEVLLRLDQAVGDQPEQLSPMAEPPHYGVRMTLPEPIGLSEDVMAGIARLLERLCERLHTHGAAARQLCLTLRRVDKVSQQVELRLARPRREASYILPLFEPKVSELDAGFGIDQLRLTATEVETVPAQQISHMSNRSHGQSHDRIDDLITRIGNRIGLDNVQRFLPADSHIPERSFITASAAYSDPEGSWETSRPRPLRLFPPEPIVASGSQPPQHFRWRRMSLTAGRTIGPERIAPEWWLEDANWRSGVRDYWQVDTRQGWRLWLFYTPQNPGWYVQGEFA